MSRRKSKARSRARPRSFRRSFRRAGRRVSGYLRGISVPGIIEQGRINFGVIQAGVLGAHSAGVLPGNMGNAGGGVQAALARGDYQGAAKIAATNAGLLVGYDDNTKQWFSPRGMAGLKLMILTVMAKPIGKALSKFIPALGKFINWGK